MFFRVIVLSNTMKLLNRYIAGNLVFSFLFSLGIFTFVLMTGNAMRLVRLIAAGMQLSDFLGAMVYLLPYMFSFAIPMAALTASILVFGRMSADNEVTAMRASGISLYQVISPAVLLGVILTLFCAYLNIELAPKSKTLFERQRGKILEKDPLAVLNAGGWTNLGQFQIKVSNRSGDALSNIIILEWLPNGQLKQQTFAGEGHLQIDKATKQATLTLINAHTHHLEREPDGSDFRDVDIPSEEQVITFDLASLYEDGRQSWKLSNLTLVQLVDRLESAEMEGLSTMPIMVEIHKRMAFSFAAFAFIILAIPVGIRTSRRETFIGIAVSLVLVFAYYLFIIIAESLADRNDMRPIILMWTPNILFEILGAYLLHRTVRV